MTEHPLVIRAQGVLQRAANLCERKWHRATAGKGYGIPEALAEASTDRVARVLAERACVERGIDVWWNDLICLDGAEAAKELRAVSIDPARLYGEQWEANLGLLVLASTVDNAHLNALGNCMSSTQYDLFIVCVEIARDQGLELQLQHLCEDIAFCVANDAVSPAGVARRLKGIRALECVAVHHVLGDLIPLEVKRQLVEPVARVLLPASLRY